MIHQLLWYHFRRYCILEVWTAIEASVPIVSLLIRGKGYDFEKTQQVRLYIHANVVVPCLCPCQSLLQFLAVDPRSPFIFSRVAATPAQQLKFLDTELERLNPGASKLLKQYGLDPVDAAWKLSQVIPKIIR